MADGLTLQVQGRDGGGQAESQRVKHKDPWQLICLKEQC